VSGRWFRLDLEEGEERDRLDLDDLDASRARVLVARYGLVCRELLERELPALRWGRVFTALRRLELSGELFAGNFFEGLDGPQFMGLEAFALLGELERATDERPLWLNALDPATSALAAREGALATPQRVAASRICVAGGRIVAASTRSYKELVLTLDPEDPLIADAFSLFANARSRASSPVRRIVLETVNGLSASRSPYAAALAEVGFEADRGRMVLW
jgi:ATP-dependent Lhr-like helicase